MKSIVECISTRHKEIKDVNSMQSRPNALEGEETKLDEETLSEASGMHDEKIEDANTIRPYRHLIVV